MKIIIVGCGKVGTALTAQLSREDNLVTVIDTDSIVVRNVSNTYDVMGIVGNGASYQVLQEADIEQGGRKKNVGNMTFEQSGAFSIPIQIPQIVRRKNPPPCRNAPLPRRINIETAAVCRENQNASNRPIWRM